MEMTEEKKEIKIEFAPGAFDQFEGTQEELDELVAEVRKMFAGKSAEEIAAMSRQLNEDDIDELPDEVLEKLDNFFSEDDYKRKLQ